MKKAGWVLALTLIAMVAMYCGGCGGSDDDGTTDGDTTDGDTTDGDASDGDTTDGDTSDGDVTDGDVEDGDVTDGDNVSDEDREALREVLNKVVAALQINNAAAFDQDLAPLMSESYSWAGCNKAERLLFFKQEAEAEDAGTDVTLALIDDKITIEEGIATINGNFNLTIAFPPLHPLNALGAEGIGTYSLILDCQKEQDEWKIIRIKSGPIQFTVTGGPNAKRAGFTGLTVAPAEGVAPGGTVTISGSVTLPEGLSDTEGFSGAIGVEWDTRMDNPDVGGIDEEIIWAFPEDTEGSFELNLTLPNDGIGADAIPENFQKGRDTIELTISAISSASDTGDFVGFTQFYYEIPLTDFTNE